MQDSTSIILLYKSVNKHNNILNSNISQYIWLHVSAYLILSNLQANRSQSSDMKMRT